jgi:hypothetical protein
MSAAVLRRLMALLVGSSLVDDASSVDVSEPDAAIVGSLIAQSPHWVGLLDTVSDDSVTVNMAATSERWRLAQRLPERVDRTAIYDITHRTWRLTAAHRTG